MQRITIEDVATAAGVSPTTVSHVFSGRRPVSEATRALVSSVAAQLGYRPNAVARSLRMQRTSTVMIVLPDITNPFYPAFARGAQDALRVGDYQTILCNTDSREDEERAFLNEALARRLDGVIFMGYWVSAEELRRVADAGVAVAHLGGPAPGSTVDSVHSVDREAAASATAFLLQRYGHAVALIDGEPAAAVAQSRRGGFHDAFRAVGATVPAGYERDEDFTIEGGRRGLAALLALPEPPRAVFCANDLIALGALEVAVDAGLDVPGDLAICGYDDIPAASLVRPALTTVHNSADLLGTACGELLLSRMTGEYRGPGREVVIPSELVVRQSA